MSAGAVVVHLRTATLRAPGLPAACGVEVVHRLGQTRLVPAVTCEACLATVGRSLYASAGARLEGGSFVLPVAGSPMAERVARAAAAPAETPCGCDACRAGDGH